VPAFIAERCTELERGARMVDAMITNTMLPDISRELLQRMMEAKPVARVHVTAKDGQFQYAFE
jgi:type VI secretion system protein VasG